MAHVQWTHRASDALATIILDRRREVGFIAARALRQKITDQTHLLQEFPRLGRQRSANEESRELVVPPYIVSYQIVGDTVSILDIFHARSAFPDDDVDDDVDELDP